MLAKDSPLTLWRQVKIELRDKALKELAPGDRIPTEPELCAQFGVSRITVRQAVSSLVREGILATQRGRGTYVLPPKIASRLDSSTSSLEGKAAKVMLYSFDRISADEWQAGKLGVPKGEELYRIRRVRLVEDEPLAYVTLFLLPRLFPEFTRPELESESFSQLLICKAGLTPEKGEETIECIQADSFRSNILRVPSGSPLLVVETRAFLPSGEVMGFFRAYHRADRTRLTREASGSQVLATIW
ncbi:MAG TPA: GntR family transcriptional regulator [Chloroflexota bacterium]|nr:GntR family transcriptional regulator [Chloroflexota bacterium]